MSTETKPRGWLKWEGIDKYLTKDCLECPYYREIGEEYLCGWGIGFKFLVEREKSRKCEVKNRPLDHEPSTKFLDRLI